MHRRHLDDWRLLAALIGVIALALPVSELQAQGITTAAIEGTVRAADGSNVDGALVEVVNGATGFAVDARVRHGRFLVQGLEVGGAYTIEIDRLGYLPQRIEDVFLRLGESREVAFVLKVSPVAVDTLRVVAAPFPQVSAHGGTATTIADSLLHRLPTLNRNLYDFVRLVPQISTKTGLAASLSGGGAGLRFNDFLINGASERTLSGGLTSNQNGGKSVPLEAVREYQVLLAPYDVRYGDFAGALVNTVTRSGTNRFEGSAFTYWRNDHLAQGGALAADPYDQWQYGFSLGGPVLRDRLHFFVAPEFQHLTSPAPGPWVGQPSTATPPVAVRADDLERVDQILDALGLEAGSGGPVKNETPLRNVFTRLDLALPEWDSRAILSVNHARTRNFRFSRDAQLFPLTSFASTQSMNLWTTSLQLNTALPRVGGHNELLVSGQWASLQSLPEVEQPIVEVVVPGTSSGAVTILTGTPDIAQGGTFDSERFDLEDVLTLPLGASHALTLGLELERFRIDRGGLAGSFGQWTFSSLDSLEAGLAERYVIRRDFGSAEVPLRGGQYSAYAGDRWQVGERVAITMGVRGDVLAISGNAHYNAEVDSIFDRRTDERPPRRLHVSPRLGFTWDLSDAGTDRLRGGVGIFTGRPPLAWIHSALASYGVGIGVLRCGSLPNDAGPPPPFVPDRREAPTACASGAGIATAPRGDVDLLDGDLRMARTLRGSLAYDRRLPWDLVATAEVLATRSISDFVFVNLNLEGPQAVDRYGRVLYGAIQPTGLAVPVLRSAFSEVIDLRNTSRNHAVQLSARVERRFADGAAAMASYTFSRVRDVQTPIRVNVPGAVNWASRAVSGRHDDLDPEISLNDVPHRIVLAGTFRAPWRRWATELSFYYVGESGAPFTFRSWGVGRRGDLNADGSNVNDPIYVPREAFDPDEILFSGRSDDPGADNSPEAQAERLAIQQAAFEQRIERSDCLREQRGRIVERNSCREPWSHTTIASVRQSIPIVGGALEVELDAFNVLNLLNDDWGLYRVATPALLEQVAQTPGPPEESTPIFRYDATAEDWTTLTIESAFQLQLAVRYRF
ncbi:MAG TPA: carboxypeptidase regulatory-like domain-containing protein [Gemmatimonadota bacterium]|nr:carboxypeptidase regulatory-like domain-containing protein [Gemmatimonadota bacterium]